MAVVKAAVVVAIEHSADNLADIMDTLDPATNADVEFVICHTGQVGSAATNVDGLANVAHIECPPGSRIPHLWRDGLLACRSEKVAFLTAHCVPDTEWMTTVKSIRFEDDVAAVGGFFVQPHDADGIGWAVYLLRYVGYSRPHPDGNAGNVAADNAVYRRSALLACADLLRNGFWEPSFHARFARKGLRLTLTPDLVVLHQNRYSPSMFASQRRAHGAEFGADRALTASPSRRIILGMAAPAAPLILLGKVFIRTVRAGLLSPAPWSAYGYLVWFVLNWAVGEARGTWRILLGRT